MWQQVTVGDEQLLKTAHEVLVVHDGSWGSLQLLVAWMQQPSAALFYFQGANFELVVGYRFKTPNGEWRIEPGGVRGALSHEALKVAVEKTVAFMKAQGTRAIFARSTPRGGADPIQMMLEAVAAAARQHPAIQEVSEQTVGPEVRWGVVLK